MIRLDARPAIRIAGLLLGGFALILSGCSSDEDALPTVSSGIPGEFGATMGSQARLWISIENAENTYIGASDDPWLKDSWYSEAQDFDIVVTNNSDFDVDEVFLLVTIPLDYKNIPGWMIQIGDQTLVPEDFVYTDTDAYGFDGGSHGVYPPSGTGVFYPYPMNATLAAGGSWSTHVTATRGTADGFRIHFDAGSARFWSPPSHDATILPPIGAGPATEACCFDDGHCEVLTPDDCEAQGGTTQGDGTVCDPNPCPPAGACCIGSTSTCVMLTEAACDSAGGGWNGPGTTCDPDPCSGGD